jgi:hypothetical protein
MRFNYKRSKITGMTKWGFRSGLSRGQEGMASIIVVSVLIVIMTLITIGFTRLVTRSAVNSANRQFSASATYAAQSAINDVASYIKQYAAANSGNPLLPKSTTCTGNGSLIGNSTSQGPFYDKSQLSSNTTTRYTCLLLNPTPSTLVFTQVQNLKSQVVKINTSASAGALDKLLLSWQPSDSQITGFPTSPSDLNDETTWNSSTGICKDSGGANASCIPVLRVAIFPISNGESLTSPQAQSKTIFLYPQGGGVNVPVKPFGAISDGSLVPIPCTQHIAGAGDFNPTTSTGYVCNVILSALASAATPSGTDSVYLRITPIYNQADVRLAADDRFGNALNFINDQAIIDATAQTSGVVKRLQARADTSSLANGATSADTNIASNSNDIPEQAVRSANALCKRELLVKPSVTGFPPFVSFDDPDTVCHDQGSTPPNPPIITQYTPTLAFSIIGADGQDAGKRVCSTGDAPETALWGCTTSANPDSPQSPLQPGTVFINSSDTLYWQSTQATACNAGGGWSGNPLTSVSGTNNTGSGSQGFGGITTVTEYDLTCTRTGTPTPTPTKKVFAWPQPTVSLTVPGSVEAGSNYDVSWTVSNSISCALTGGNWTNPSDNRASVSSSTFSQTMNWPVNDNTSTRFFTVTCKDPIGRTATATKPVGVSNAPGDGRVVAPTCGAVAWFSGDGTVGNTSINWATDCDYWDAGNPCELSRHIDSDIPGIGSQDGSPCYLKSGSVTINSTGTFHFDIYVWATPWGDRASASTYVGNYGPALANSGQVSITIYPPMTIDFNSNSGVWDQGPVQCAAGVKFPDGTSAAGTWWCRNNQNALQTYPNGIPGCANGVHRFTTCDFYYQASGGSGNFNCQLFSSYNLVNPFLFNTSSTGGAYNTGGPFGWSGAGNPNPFYLSCTDNVTGQTQFIPKNIP